MLDPTSGIAVSLRNFLSEVKYTLAGNPTLQGRWITAEISDFRVSRHCYMQLLEKDPTSGITLATARATIWSSKFAELNRKFEAATNLRLAGGMQVMLCVSVNMSEQYGLSLNVIDISPEYTLGDMQRQRQEIIARLKREGLIDMNKANAGIPLKPQRIAVVSAAGAAGYGDFCKQLANNGFGIKFYTCLFAATMQGQNTVPTVISALDRINRRSDLFDVVVIIRGGGATTDLNSFDNYELAVNVANCQLPVITGIGHDRDTTVLDYVAAIPVKTPTAAAEWLISQCSKCLQTVTDYETTIVNTVTSILSEERQHLQYINDSIPLIAKNIIDKELIKLNNMLKVIPANASGKISAANALLDKFSALLLNVCNQTIKHERMRIEALSDKVNLLSPQNILNRGYSLTLCNGQIVTDATQLKSGDELTTRFKSGEATSIVK